MNNITKIGLSIFFLFNPLSSSNLHANTLSVSTKEFKIGDIGFKISLSITSSEGYITLTTDSENSVEISTNFSDLQNRTVYSFPVSGLIQMKNSEGLIVTLGDKQHSKWGSVWLFSSDLATRSPKPILSKSIISSRAPLKTNFQTKMAINRIAAVPGQFTGSIQDVTDIQFRFPIIVTKDERSVSLELDSKLISADYILGEKRKTEQGAAANP